MTILHMLRRAQVQGNIHRTPPPAYVVLSETTKYWRGVSLSVSNSTGTPHGTTRVPALARAEAEQSEIWDNSSEEARQ